MATEFCLWDDTTPEVMTIAGVTADVAAFKRRNRHAKQRDRRGGLMAIAEQSRRCPAFVAARGTLPPPGAAQAAVLVWPV